MNGKRDFFLALDTEAKTAKLVNEIPASADFLICMEMSVPLMIPDNAVGRCAHCDCPIQFRPIAPAAVPKVCMKCAPAWFEAHKNPN